MTAATVQHARALHIEEMLRLRVLAQSHLKYFLQLRFLAEGRKLVWSWHLDLLCELLEAQTWRDPALRFLLVNIFPGSLKSETISQTWHPWMIGQVSLGKLTWDWASILSAANSADLAGRDSDVSRGMLREPWYQEVFPGWDCNKNGQHMPWGKDSENRWIAPNRCVRERVGAGTRTTGLGRNRLLADDLLDAGDAMSDIKRENINKWWRNKFFNRLRDRVRGTITVVAQRLHERDLPGILLEDWKGKPGFYHVNIPLEAKKAHTVLGLQGQVLAERAKGDIALPPERMGPAQVEELKTTMKITYEAQFNQDPTPQDGTIFKTSALRLVDTDAPTVIKRFGLKVGLYWDFATKEKQTQKDDPDYTVGMVMAKDSLFRWWILDIWREQAEPGRVAEAIIYMFNKYKPVRHLGEQGQIETAMQPLLNAKAQASKQQVIINTAQVAGLGDKVQRCYAFAMAVNAGHVYVPARAPWLQDFIAELKRFPFSGDGIHDDQVDAGGIGFRDMQNLPLGEMPPFPERMSDKPWALTGKQAEQLMRDLERQREEQLRSGEEWWS